MFTLIKRIFKIKNKGLDQALQSGAIIVDVRTKPEFEEGHISGSRNIPLEEIKLKIEMIRQWNQPVVTVCRNGNRSAMATGILQTAGIKVYNGGSWTTFNKK